MGALVAFAAALLAGLGIGSGGLYLLYLLEVAGVPQYAAQGMNLLFFSLSALASTLLHGTAGRLSSARLLPLLLFGGVGTLAGSLLTLLIPAAIARRAFGVLTVLGGGLTLLRRIRGSAERKNTSDDRNPLTKE